MLGLELVKVASGYALIRMAFSEEAPQHPGRCHGGAIFSLIDEAFQIASNSSGKMRSPSSERLVHEGPPEGEVLTAEARLVDSSRRISHFLIESAMQPAISWLCQGHGLSPGRPPALPLAFPPLRFPLLLRSVSLLSRCRRPPIREGLSV